MRGRSQFVGAAGQHYVAYCLAIRGVHAAITLGNVPDVDIIIAKSNGSLALSVQVKTSRWAHRPSRYGKESCEWDVGESAVDRCADNLWYALVDLQERESGGPSWEPRVFLVPSWWVGKFVKKEWSRKMYWLPREAWPQCLERWDRIPAFFTGEADVYHWCRNIPTEALP